MKNILIVTYWDWNDALIQTNTLPYVKIIADVLPENSKIYIITLNKRHSKISFQHPKIKILSFRYVPFGLKAILHYSIVMLYLFFLLYIKKISTIHCWCTPAGVLGYLLSKLSGKPLIIDSYEPHAEAMVEVGEWKKTSLAYKILFYFENKMTHHAKFLIATSQGTIKEYAVSRYNYNPSKNNWFVKPACVNLELFKPCLMEKQALREKLHLNNKIVGIYAGKFGGIYLEDEFFEWLSVFQDTFKDKSYFIILSAHSKDYMQRKYKQHNIDIKNILHLFVPHQEVAKYLNVADFAISPIKPVYTKKFCAPIKNAEYFAMNLYLIISKDISEDSDLVEKYQLGYVIQNWNKTEYLKSMEKLKSLFSHQNSSIQNHYENSSNSARDIAQKYKSFDLAIPIYQSVYQ